MKTKIKIIELTQENLVDFLSTATYGSLWLGVSRDMNDTEGIDYSDCECREDYWAKTLLSGKNVIFSDYNAVDKDEYYGKRQHRWDEGNQCMDYFISLQNVIDGLEKAANSVGYASESFHRFANESSNFDLEDADTLAQWILFGEAIYG